jgi:hypothetical protein
MRVPEKMPQQTRPPLPVGKSSTTPAIPTKGTERRAVGILPLREWGARKHSAHVGGRWPDRFADRRPAAEE